MSSMIEPKVAEKAEQMMANACTHMRYWEDQKKFQLGWKCEMCGKSWTFNLFSELKKMPHGKWREIFRTRESRAMLTAMMGKVIFVRDEVPA